jgi:hypothetical protein
MRKFKVTSGGLNLRTAGVVDATNIITVLPKGKIVTRIGNELANQQFWKVSLIDGREGFVGSSFLSQIPAVTEKVLWVVNYPDLNWFVTKASFVGATAVAIRTDNDMDAAIAVLHPLGIKVYGWRWPSAEKQRALAEARKVVDWYGKGLDGYYVDPEGEPGQHFDWNRNGLDSVADEFCKTITSADPNKPFGTTSHYRGEKVFDKLPWDVFFKYSSVLLPQAYWRVDVGNLNGAAVKNGDPKENYIESLKAWTVTGGQTDKIIPMAGELDFSTVADIEHYFEEVVNQNKTAMHFYTANENVDDKVWNAVKQVG